MRHLIAVLTLQFCAASFSGHVAAQQNSGRIEGIVVDVRTRAPQVDINLELVLGSGSIQRTLTTRTGRFLFAAVPAGEHRLRITGGRVQPLELSVRVRAGETTTLSLQTEATAFGLDTMRVVLEPLATRPGETEFGTRIDARALRLLPTAYNPEAAIALVPGVSGERIWGGAAREANLYQVDGIALTHPGVGGYVSAISPAWVEALEVRGLGAGAELGNFQGGVVNVITRSGSNQPYARLRSSFESNALNATNLVEGEIGRERNLRAEIEAERSGPIVRDRLFYFAAAHVLRDDFRALNRIPRAETRYLPDREQRSELRGFGKLTWLRGPTDRVDVSAALARTTGDDWGITGYEAPGAAPELSASSYLVQLMWQRQMGSGALDVRVAGAGTSEESSPRNGDSPAVRFFTHGDPPTATFRNALFSTRHDPATLTALARITQPFRIAATTHELQLGGELNRSSFTDQRLRTGGMTWRPARGPAFSPDLPQTWFASGFVPTDWGGEVDLHARTQSYSAFLQNRMELASFLALNVGVRWSSWAGDLLPGGSTSRRFRAIEADAIEPRIGLVLQPTASDELLFKAHWGRYHQNLLASFFDRIEGGDVFSNRELWYFSSEPFADPNTVFTREQRDAMSSGPSRFALQEVIRLNETGRLDENYRQPYIEQWIVGVEKSFGGRTRIEAVFVNRRNHQLVGLIDRNREQNYHRWDNVQVRNLNGNPIGFGAGPLTLPGVYVPKDAIRKALEDRLENPDAPIPPGFTVADIPNLTFEQDLVLGNLPGAYRQLRQLQLTARFNAASWGLNGSLVLSKLEGNIDAVTPYEAGTNYERYWETGAGPFVRPSEWINAEGELPGFNPIEIKLSAYGELPWGFRGGAFLDATRGPRFTPYYTISSIAARYFVEGGELPSGMMSSIAGHRVFAQPRGAANYGDRVTLDLHAERELPIRSGRWRASLDVFNLWNANPPTRINASLTYPTATPTGIIGVVDNAWVFRSVWERVPPRTVRLGLNVEF